MDATLPPAQTGSGMPRHQNAHGVKEKASGRKPRRRPCLDGVLVHKLAQHEAHDLQRHAGTPVLQHLQQRQRGDVDLLAGVGLEGQGRGRRAARGGSRRAEAGVQRQRQALLPSVGERIDPCSIDNPAVRARHRAGRHAPGRNSPAGCPLPGLRRPCRLHPAFAGGGPCCCVPPNAGHSE